ncbi:MAG: radical SAM protein [Chloroflexota bacterium]
MAVAPPFFVSFSITGKCNLNCKHCYSEAKEERLPDELSTAEAVGLIEDVAGWGIGLLVLDGGEPLCMDDVLEVEERRQVMEGLAGAQEDCSIVIRVPACPMYPLVLQQRGVQPKHIPMHELRRWNASRLPHYTGQRRRDPLYAASRHAGQRRRTRRYPDMGAIAAAGAAPLTGAER